MLTFNEEHELTVLKALVDYNLYCFDRIRKAEKWPSHCEFWCKEKKKAQSALDAADRYFNTKNPHETS